MTQLEINDRIISQDSPVYVIAEISGNHCGDLELCKKLFKIAKDAGADAVKLVKRCNKMLYTKALYNSPYDNENSYGKTYGEHREFLEFGLDEYLELNELAKELNIDFFATAFDIPSADFLKSIQMKFDLLAMPAYKIASGSLTNIELISHIANFNKPMIISTGGATFEDIDRVYKLLHGRAEFALLHCIASYPNKPEEINLSVIQHMIKRYPDAIIGFSNHHPSIKIPLSASLMGAKIIETHFTLNRAYKGTDHAFSLEPKGLQTLCEDLKDVQLAIGDGEKRKLSSEEKPLRKMAQSVRPIKSIKAGEVLTPDNIGLKTPADGMPACKYKEVLGKISINNLTTADILKEEDYE